MCKGYESNSKSFKPRCTCKCKPKELSIPRNITDIIDLTPLHEFEDIEYRDDITNAYEYLERVMRYNNPINY